MICFRKEDWRMKIFYLRVHSNLYGLPDILRKKHKKKQNCYIVHRKIDFYPYSFYFSFFTYLMNAESYWKCGSTDQCVWHENQHWPHHGPTDIVIRYVRCSLACVCVCVCMFVCVCACVCVCVSVCLSFVHFKNSVHIPRYQKCWLSNLGVVCML